MYGQWHLFRVAFSLLDKALPKVADSFVVLTPGQLDDQARETIRALKQQGFNRITWVVTTPHGGAHKFEGTPVLKKKSLVGLLAYLLSGVVLHSHGCGNLAHSPSQRKRFVNLWHGMPLKRLADVGLSPRESDAVLATASCHVENLAVAFGVPMPQVHVTGLPRNDVLVRAAAKRKSPLHDRQRVVAWLPTFRDQVRGNNDGHDAGNPFQLSGATYGAVEALAKKYDLRLVVKHHRNVVDPQKYWGDRVEVWNDDTLNSLGLTLYELLGRSDLLITDYSSVWIDYLLVDRPIIFVAEDEVAYRETRGLYDLERTGLRPGDIVGDMIGLSEALESAIYNDRWAAMRRTSADLHHVHQDCSSAHRVAILGARLNSRLSRGRRIVASQPRSGRR